MIRLSAKATSLAWLLLLGAPNSALAKPAGDGSTAAPSNRVESVHYDDGRVIIRTEKRPTYSVFRLADPFRVLIDINGVAEDPALPLQRIEKHGVRYLSTSRFQDERESILRVEVGLDAPAKYAVRTQNNTIVLKLPKAIRAAQAKTTQAKPAAPTLKAAPAKIAEAQRSVAPAPRVQAAGPEKKAPVRLGKIRRFRGRKSVRLRLAQKGELGSDQVQIEALDNPPRLLVHLQNATAEPKWQRVKIGRFGVRRARLGSSDDGVRLVFDLKKGRPLPEIDVESDPGALLVRLQPARPKAAPAPALARAATDPAPRTPAPAKPPVLTAHAAPAPNVVPPRAAVAQPIAEAKATQLPSPAPVAAQPAPRTAPMAAQPAPRTAPMAAQPVPATDEAPVAACGAGCPELKDVRFEPKDGFFRLTLAFDRPVDALDEALVEGHRRADEKRPGLRITGAKMAASLQRTLDTTLIATDVVHSVSVFQKDGAIQLQAALPTETEHRHWKKDRRIMWDFRNMTAGPQPSGTPPVQTASYEGAALRAKSQLITGAKKYNGRRITLDFHSIEIRNVLRLIADVSKLNIVASDDVKGTITIKLRNVPWDQALDIILASKGLDKTRIGNIIRVAPLEVIRAEEQARIERQKARIELEPLTVRLIPVSYAVADEIRPQVAALLSPRGKVNIDKRTNVLVVEDIRSILTKVERLVKTLDTQTPQVLIEARIVEAQSSFERNLGIQWGGQVSMTQQYGTSTGLAFPNNVRISGGSDDQSTPTEGTLGNPNFAVNLPAPVGAGRGGSLGFIFGSAGGAALLNLRLTAAEATGKIKIISSPKIVTLDNKKATILSGEKIPITVITANGPTTRFINANIELGVTPHVTQDGSILMSINARKNELSGRTDQFGTPGIFTKEATTEMIVKDGDTAVLGGLYQRTARESQSFVPWIGRIPVLGWLFKGTQSADGRDELLIFISPRIVNRSQALVQQ